jgi:hypothetical protein
MTGTAVEEVKAIVLAGAGELLGEDSPYERGRRALRNEYKPILAASAELRKVESAEDAQRAVEFGRLLQNGTKEMEAYFKGIKLQIDAIKKPVLDAEKEDGGLLNAEKNRLAVMLTTYREKVEAERREAERKERERQEAEMKAERERLAQQARDEQIARALEAEDLGDIDQATAILDEVTVIAEPVAAPPTIIQAAAPTRFAGSSGKTSYSAKVTNLMALVKAVAEGKAPLQALTANESFINAQARAYKEGFSMPGCELDKATGTSFRR